MPGQKKIVYTPGKDISHPTPAGRLRLAQRFSRPADSICKTVLRLPDRPLKISEKVVIVNVEIIIIA
jgi:hypothetical protein